MSLKGGVKVSFLKGKNQKAERDHDFQDYLHKEKEKLYRMAFLYVKNQNDALEIVQETIFKAYKNLDSLREWNYFSTWITRILINTSLDYIKKNSRIQVTDILEWTQGEEPKWREEHLDLVDSINRLDAPYKTVIILRYYKDFSIKQIAELLNCPEGTVKSNIHRGLMKLKIDLKEDVL